MNKKVLSNQNIVIDKDFSFIRSLISIVKYYLIFLVVICITGYFFWLWYMNLNEVVSVPNVVNNNVATAKMKISDLHLIPVIQHEYSSEVEENLIVRQIPEPGKKIREKRKVTLMVSQGAQMIAVPDFRGLSLNEVFETVEKLRNEDNFLQIGNYSRVYSDEVEKDYVITQSPLPNTKITKNIKVDLLISNGSEPKYVYLPELQNKSIPDAEAELKKLNLKIDKIEQISKDLPDQVVIKTKPEAWTKVKEGDVITVYYNSLTFQSGTHTKRFIQIPYITPKYLFSKRVKIILTDQAGSREIYNKIVPPSKKIFISTYIVGAGKYTIYLDGKFADVKEIKSPD